MKIGRYVSLPSDNLTEQLCLERFNTPDETLWNWNSHNRYSVETQRALTHLKVSGVTEGGGHRQHHTILPILHTVPHPKANGVLAVGLYGLLEKTLKCEEMFVGCSSYHYWKCWLAGHCGGISPPLMRLSWFWPMERELTSAWISLADLLWIITSYYVLKCSLNASEFSSELWYYNFELNALKSSLKRFIELISATVEWLFFLLSNRTIAELPAAIHW